PTQLHAPLASTFYYLNHSGLHPFPTRRSSDLWPASLARACAACRRTKTSSSCNFSVSAEMIWFSREPNFVRARITPERIHVFSRSEEHTSELQSRVDLV